MPSRRPTPEERRADDIALDAQCAANRLHMTPRERARDLATEARLRGAQVPMSTADAAKQLGVSLRRVQAMILSGRLPALRVGRAWLVYPADLDAVRGRRPGRPRKSI